MCAEWQSLQTLVNLLCIKVTFLFVLLHGLQRTLLAMMACRKILVSSVYFSHNIY